MVTIYHNPRCSKSREALSILEAEVGAVNIKEYLKTGLEESEVRELISLLENDISELIRTNEKLFKDAPFDPGVTEGPQGRRR